MRTGYLIILYTLLLCLAGCATKSANWPRHERVIVDTQGVDMAQYRADLEQCSQYSDQVQTGKKVARGTLGGAAVGGLIGAAVGDSSTAQKGAGAGSVTGGAGGLVDSYREKNQVVKNCLRGRGYRVLN